MAKTKEEPMIAALQAYRLTVAEQWHLFYQEVLGIPLELPLHDIPNQPEVVAVSANLTWQALLRHCQGRIQVECYAPYLTTEPANTHTRTGNYVVHTHEEPEITPEPSPFNGKSVEVTNLSLRELVLRELFHTIKKMIAPAQSAIIVCNGSIDAEGFRPSAQWYGHRLRICWHDKPRASQAA
jgi:hypothetical protein